METKVWLSPQCQERVCYLWAQAVWPGSLGWHCDGYCPAPSLLKGVGSGQRWQAFKWTLALGAAGSGARRRGCGWLSSGHWQVQGLG